MKLPVRILLAAGLGLFPISVATAETWEPSRGPEGGVILALAIQNGALFAGTRLGVYRSQDAGASWSLSDLRLNDSVTALTVLGTTLFAGTYQSGVFRSEDGGSTWVAASQGLSSLYVASLGIVGGRLFAGTLLGQIFVSDDRGSSWFESSSGLHGVHTGTFAFRNGEIYAGLYPAAFPPPASPGGGVFKSVDGGNTWIHASAGLGDYAGVRALLFSGDTLFAAAGGLYRSRDGAASWVASGLGGNVTALVDTGYALFAGSSVVAGSDGGVFQSVDGGLTWSRTGLQTIDVEALAFSDGLLYAGTPAGVFASADGGFSWRLKKSGMFNTYASSLFTAFEDVFAIVQESASQDALFLSAKGGRTWSESGQGLPEGRLVPGVAQGNAIYLGVLGAGVYKSVDGGRNWFSSSTLQVALLGASATVLFAFGGYPGSFFRSTDGGASWIRGQADLPDYESVHSFAFVGDSVYAGGSFGVYKSVNAGVSWTRTSLFTGGDIVSAPSGELYAVTRSSGTFRSRDGGASWTPMSPPSRSPIFALVSVGGNLFAATGDDGIYRSVDNGASWQPANQGLAATSIAGLIASDGALFAAVSGYGVQTLHLRSPLAPAPRRPWAPRVVSR